jgi:hypothetical protein
MGSRDTVSQLAGRAGDPSAARALAAQNGFESIRSPGAAMVQLSAEVELRAAVAFAAGGSIGLSAGVSLGAGASAGAGLDLDFGAFAGGGLSAGAGAAASAGAGGAGERAAGGAGGAGGGLRTEGLSSLDLGTSSDGGAAGTGTGGGLLGTLARRLDPSIRPSPPAGGSSTTTVHEDAAKLTDLFRTQGSRGAGGGRERGAASSGVPASQGAFDALTEGRGFRRHKPLDVESLVRPVELRHYGTGSGVGFRIGGQATMLGAESVSADVGRNVSLRERIAFDRERGGG